MSVSDELSGGVAVALLGVEGAATARALKGVLSLLALAPARPLCGRAGASPRKTHPRTAAWSDPERKAGRGLSAPRHAS